MINYLIFIIIFLLILLIYLYIKLYKLQKYYNNKNLSNFISHSYEPNIGSIIRNNNKNCKHFKSIGVVIKITSLNNDMGKVITYKVLNKGNNYNIGDILTKTMDQLITID